MIKRILTLSIAVMAALVAHAEVFDVRGQVLQLRPINQSAVIAHEEIPGFMPAMTMPFRVEDRDELMKLNIGDIVTFEFVVEQKQSYARNFEVVGNAARPSAASASASSRAPKLEEGSVVPDTELTDQSGEPVTLADDEGRYTVMTFIFTRCPTPEFCPLMSSNFQQIQQVLRDEELDDEVRLLSVTIDPEFDKPEILKAYGEALKADFGMWEFATADAATIEDLTEAFRVYVKENGVTLDHTLVTTLISPEGEILEMWRGNRWQPSDVLSSVNEVVASSGTQG